MPSKIVGFEEQKVTEGGKILLTEKQSFKRVPYLWAIFISILGGGFLQSPVYKQDCHKSNFHLVRRAILKCICRVYGKFELILTNDSEIA
jgi:hypothetical protein